MSVVVLFEAEFVPGDRERYLALAQKLAERARAADGFISAEWFSSLTVPGKLLLKSLWRDEAAVAAWHADEAHRQCQREGKDCCFSRFEITVLKPVEHFGKGLEEGEVHHD